GSQPAYRLLRESEEPCQPFLQTHPSNVVYALHSGATFPHSLTHICSLILGDQLRPWYRPHISLPDGERWTSFSCPNQRLTHPCGAGPGVVSFGPALSGRPNVIGRPLWDHR